MRVDPIAVRLVVDPVAIVNVPVRVDKSTLSIGLIVHKVALIYGPIRPDLKSATLSHFLPFKPLASVSSTRSQHC